MKRRIASVPGGTLTRRQFSTAVLAAGMLPAGCTSSRNTSKVVATAYGRVRGFANATGTFAFKGIHYGADTGGNARFLPPRSPKPWSGIFDANAFGQRSPQFNQFPEDTQTDASRIFAPLVRDEGPIGEDCLVLNVWSKNVYEQARKPVMVYIHRGRWMGGSGAVDGAPLVERGDVVVVSVNHRLGALGYLQLGEVAGDAYASSGNAGVMDLVQALEWIRDNIEAFGGDPGRVLLFGQSGGAQKISMLLATPAARGLFHRAVIMSGPGNRMLTLEQANESAQFVLDRLSLGKPSWQRLREVPAAQLLEVQNDLIHTLQMHRYAGLLGGFAGVRDGIYLPEHPFDAQAPTVSAEVPILIGTTGCEMNLYAIGYPQILQTPEDRIDDFLAPRLGQCTDKIINVFRRANPDMAPGRLLLRVMSDFWLRYNSTRIAEQKAAQNAAPAFLYQIEYASDVRSASGVDVGSTHSIDVALAFDITDQRKGMYGNTPGTARAAAVVSTTWAAFAHHGDPNNAEIPAWPRYDPVERATMLLDAESRLVIRPQNAEYEALKSCHRALTHQIPLMKKS